MAERTMPHSLEAELSVLGAALLRADALGDVIDTLKSQDFWRAAHGTIYESMVALWQVGTAIDLLTVRVDLERRGELERVGGVGYIAKLVDGVPLSTNIAHYAGIVAEKARLREVATWSQKVTARAVAQEDTSDQLLESVERELRETAQRSIKGWFVSGQELSQRIYADLERWQQSQGITGLSTGFDELDAYTTGLQPGELILIAARPSMGKTAFALQIAHHIGVTQRKPVAVFSLEMGVDALGVRMACGAAGVPMFRAKKGWIDQDETARILSALLPIEESQLYFDDAMTVRVADIRRKARQLLAKHGLAALIIDYLQLLDSEETRRSSNRTEDLSKISRALKKLAKELMIPVIALSQLSRAPETRPDKRPKLSDLRESGALEQDADVVIFIFRPAVYDQTSPPTAAEIIIAKQRNGPLATVNVHWDAELTRFENLAPPLGGMA